MEGEYFVISRVKDLSADQVLVQMSGGSGVDWAAWATLAIALATLLVGWWVKSEWYRQHRYTATTATTVSFLSAGDELGNVISFRLRRLVEFMDIMNGKTPLPPNLQKDSFVEELDESVQKYQKSPEFRGCNDAFKRLALTADEGVLAAGGKINDLFSAFQEAQAVLLEEQKYPLGKKFPFTEERTESLIYEIRTGDVEEFGRELRNARKEFMRVYRNYATKPKCKLSAILCRST